MGDVVVTWRADAVRSNVEAAVARAMERVGQALATTTQSRLSTPYPPASSPGQPPHRRSGGLKDAVGSRVVRAGGQVTLSVGVPATSPVVAQARALASGTSRMAARPFLGAIAAAGAVVAEAVRSEVARSVGN